jgi:predicted Ser/Thr protein kinase
MEENLTIYENRKFIIFNVNEIYLIDFSKVKETSQETLRKNVDKNKTFVKWDGETPEFVNSLTTKEGPYTYLEILNILSTSEWTNS